MAAIKSQTGFTEKDLGADFMSSIDTMISSKGGIDEGEAKAITSRLRLGEVSGVAAGGKRSLSGQKHGDSVALEMQLTSAVEQTQERTGKFMTETAAALERVSDVTSKQTSLIADLSK
jgi:hypothetical protein